MLLFDVQADPGETVDLAGRRPKLVDRMSKRLAKMRAELEPVPRTAISVNLSEAATQELQRLGYTGDF